MAPEVLSQKPYGPKADVYRYYRSLARLIVVLATQMHRQRRHQ
jgi:hypothetical protein